MCNSRMHEYNKCDIAATATELRGERDLWRTNYEHKNTVIKHDNCD